MKYYIKRNRSYHYYGGGKKAIGSGGWVKTLEEATIFNYHENATDMLDYLKDENPSVEIIELSDTNEEAYERAMRGVC